jgi:hypothetical protein
MYDLGCMLVESRSFEVSSDYRVYMGFKSIGLTTLVVGNSLELL